MNDCTFLVYSHSEYDDILEICLKRIKKYFNDVDLNICINDSNLISNKYKDYNISKVYEYNDNYTYHAKLASVLELIDTKYVLLHHDNNIFCDYVNINTINGIIKDISEHQMDFVRLSASGVDSPVKSDTLLLSPMTGPYYFSVFPCIWNRDTLLKLCRDLNKVYRLTEDSEAQEYTSKLKGYYISKHAKDLHKDISHFYSSVHPIHYGKWYLTHHYSLIFNIALEYDIDLLIRGEDT